MMMISITRTTIAITVITITLVIHYCFIMIDSIKIVTGTMHKTPHHFSFLNQSISRDLSCVRDFKARVTSDRARGRKAVS